MNSRLLRRLSITLHRKRFARRSLQAISTLGLLALLSPGHAQVELSHPTVSAGGGVSESAGFRLLSTVAEPAVASVSNDRFQMHSGLQATFLEQAGLPAPDAVFRDSFESIP